VSAAAEREIEWQFDAADLRPVRRWLVESAPNGVFSVDAAGSVTQTDLYFDTDDQRFARAGYALRLRRLGRRRDAEATLKGLESNAADEPGLRSRRELSEPLERPDPLLLGRSRGPVGERVRAVAGRKPLLPLFEVRTRRQRLTLVANGSVRGEIALDETTIQAPSGGRPARVRRVEIEVPESSVGVFGAFVEVLQTDCGLLPAGLSKYEAGLRTAGVPAPQPESFGATEIVPEMTIGAVALAVLRRHFAAMLAREPGTRLGDDIEELHDMRVASRRLRAALSLFRDVLPEPVSSLRDELAWIGGRLGAVRDLDVQLEQLEAWIEAAPPEDREPLRKLRAVLEAQRAEARVDMLEALDSRRYESFVRRFRRTLRARHPAKPEAAARPALAAAPELIDSRWNAVRKSAKRLGRSATAEDYHRLRIRCKRLRYALEFLTDVYDGRARPVLKQLVALQDILGLHQDAFVAVARLRTLTAERGGELGSQTTFAMGEIAERYRQSVVELRSQTLPAFRRIDGKRWTSFRKDVESRQPPTAGEAETV
jgi:CHAD domain-containing protein